MPTEEGKKEKMTQKLAQRVIELTRDPEEEDLCDMSIGAGICNDTTYVLVAGEITKLSVLLKVAKQLGRASFVVEQRGEVLDFGFNMFYSGIFDPVYPGLVVRELRETAGMTQEELAEEFVDENRRPYIGGGRGGVWNLEHNRRKPNVPLLENLVEYLDGKMYYLPDRP